MADQPRKASEVVVSIEDKVNTIIQSMSVYNMNIKLILDRVNKIYNYIEQGNAQAPETQVVGPTVPPTPQSDKEIVQTSAEHVLTVAEEPSSLRRTARSESYTSPKPEPPIQDIHRKSDQPGSSEKKVPVVQRITDSKGKDLFMAYVSIMNDQKEVIQKTKTNANGKWQAHLKPGKYFVEVMKTDTATKEEIKAMQELSIPNADSVVTLPTAIIKRPKEAL